MEDELLSLLMDRFARKVGDYLLSQLVTTDDKARSEKINSGWLTHSEAAAYIKKSPASLYKLTHERKIKFSKRGKSNFYLPEHLDQYMMDGMIKTHDEITSETKLPLRKNTYLTKIK